MRWSGKFIKKKNLWRGLKKTFCAWSDWPWNNWRAYCPAVVPLEAITVLATQEEAVLTLVPALESHQR